MAYIYTTNYGLTAVREQTPSVNDWAATYWNIIAIDSLLYGAVGHTHDGAGKLADPAGTVDVTTADTGGTVSAGKTYYAVVTFLDSYGLETGKSSFDYVTTASPLSPPSTPLYNFQATPTDLVATPGGLTGGNYYYRLTYVKGGGETTASGILAVTVPTDDTYQVTIHFDSLTTAGNGADSIYVYRKTGSTGNYVHLTTISAVDRDYYEDDNTAVPNCAKQPPTTNTTNKFNTITVDWSSITNWDDAVSVKVYITSYDDGSATPSPTFPLSNHLATTITVSISTPVTSYEWTGDTLSTGKPPYVSNTRANPSKIDLTSEVQGVLPAANLPAPTGTWEALNKTVTASSQTDFTITSVESALITKMVIVATDGGATPAVDYDIELYEDSGRTTLAYQATGVTDLSYEDKIPWEWFGSTTIYGRIINNLGADITDFDLTMYYRR